MSPFGEEPEGLPGSGLSPAEAAGSETPQGLFGDPVTPETGFPDPGLELNPSRDTAGPETSELNGASGFGTDPGSIGDTTGISSDDGFPAVGTGAVPGTASNENTVNEFSPGGLADNSTGTTDVFNPIASQPAVESGRSAAGYQVQPGDSYWTISRKVYGTARYFRVLAEFNTQTIPDPSKMSPGAMIQTPGEAVLKQMLLANSAASAGSTVAARPVGSPAVTPAQGIFFNEKSKPMYRVGKSDTLTTIAADHLGRWARWRQVYEMNRDQLNNPNKLQIGMVLKLPADASRTAMSQDRRGVR